MKNLHPAYNYQTDTSGQEPRQIEAALYLIPVAIGAAPLSDVIPAGNAAIVAGIRHFIVENIRTARRFLRRLVPTIDIDSLTFHELNRHTDPAAVSGFLAPLRAGEPVGLMSEAGCPAVADPGAYPVEIAQREGLKVVPMVGPSSILLALMASGLNGQGFAFHGYLPIEEGQRLKRLQELEKTSAREHSTQMLIETPYRNNRLLKFLADNLRPDTRLCVAAGITDPDSESILTRPAAEWRKAKYDYDKIPAIFLFCR